MPDWKAEIRQRLAGLRLEPAREAAIVEELAQYLDDHYAELLAGGMTEAEAYRQTLIELNGSELLARELRRSERQFTQESVALGTAHRRSKMITDLWQDLRYGVRMLRKNPGFTLIAVFTLGLGIGANTAIFSVINGVLLRPLPFPEPERILCIWATDARRGDNRRIVSYPNFADWQAQQTVFERIEAFEETSATLTGAGAPEQLHGADVSAALFPLLGVQPSLGRRFSEQEPLRADATAIIISEGLWRRHFGSDPQMIGRAITLNGQSSVIIGVMPASFNFPLDASRPMEFWRLLKPDQQRGSNHLNVIARLKSGVTMAQAQAGMNIVAERLMAQYPSSNTGRGIRLIGLHEDLTRNVRRALMMLWASVGCVLLIACANVANLSLARATVRQKEIAVRTALGATRGRVIRQLLVESALLAGAGGALGLLLAAASLAGLRPLLPLELPLAQAVVLDWRVLGVTLALSCFTGVFFGLMPALQAAKANLTTALNEAARRSTGGAQRKRIRSALVIMEVALALVLLVGAGLLMRSFLRLLNVHPGFNPDRVIAFDFELPDARYGQPVQRTAFYQRLTERVAALPGVEAASVGDPIPLGGNSTASIYIEGEPQLTPAERPKTQLHFIGQDYLRVLGIPLLRGRALNNSDRQGTPKAILVSETFVRRHFPNEDPLGKLVGIGIYIDKNDNLPYQIVGVVGDVKTNSLDEESGPASYLSYLQFPVSGFSLVVRTTAPDSVNIVPAVRKEVEQLDHELAIPDIRTMIQLVDASVAPQRFILLTLDMFAGLALLLAAIGIYSVMAYTVTQRTHEIGIRLALGARPAAVIRLLLGQGMRLAGIGAGAGLLAALALARLLKFSLYGVGTNDPLTLSAGALLLLGVALVACWIPARRATRVDPMIALRSD